MTKETFLIHNQGCQPYDIKPCEKGDACFLKKDDKATAPACKPYCYNPSYSHKYAADLHTGKLPRICNQCGNLRRILPGDDYDSRKSLLQGLPVLCRVQSNEIRSHNGDDDGVRGFPHLQKR